MSESIGHKAASGAIWATIDRFGYMTLQFIVNMVLANLLMPADFGVLGMLAIFITVSQVLIDGGFGSALIQKKNPTQIDYSTIFYWNIFLSIFLYSVLYIIAPLISEFYHLPLLTSVIRVIGITLIISAATAIQQTRLRKQLAFKTIAITNLTSYLISGGCAIYLAFNGWGVWSLVLNQIVFGILTITIYGILTRWIPSLCFSILSMKELFRFGGYMLAANVLQETCKNFQGLIIGKKFSDTQMGYFSQAYKLDQVTSYSIPQVIVQVMYPVYSSIQDEKERLIEILSMNIRVISYLIFPLVGLLILISEPLITGLYGEKWLPSVPYYQILCVGGLFVCLQNINFYAVAAKGYSKVLFNWSWYKWCFLLVAILIGTSWGMNGIMWGIVASNLNIYIVNSLLAQKFIGLDFFKQINLWLFILLSSIISILVSYYCFLYLFNNILVCTFIYISIYVLLSCNSKGFKDVKILLTRIIQK